MLKSMTGYGKSTCETKSKTVNIQIQTLNGKQLDINIKIPRIYKEKELAIRKTLENSLIRGKIDLSFFIEQTGENTNYQINKTLAVHYYNEIKELNNLIKNKEKTDYLQVLLNMPDVMKTELMEIDKKEWKTIEESINFAIEEVNDFRTSEGIAMEKELIERTNNILTLLKEIEKFEEKRIENIRNKIINELKNTVKEEDINMNRFEQEMIYYIEKIDITEEKVRLKKHCDYFLENITKDEAIGKKLGFISQEMGREINTLGSKANEVNIQKIVINMKSELEKIKEQILNVL